MSIKFEAQPPAGGKTIIPFVNNARPTIVNYGELYAANYGQFPTVRVIINTNDDKGYQLQQSPQFTYVNSQIDTIYFLLGNDESGCMVLSW